MYRFPEDLDLSHLVGCELVEVMHAPFNLYFGFEPENRINLTGKWRILDSSGQTVDEGKVEEPKDSYRVHLLLGHKIKKCVIVNPSLLAVQFESGWQLEIVDDSDENETCHISPNIYI